MTYPDGSLFGALGVGGPTYRMSDDRVHTRIAPRLLKTAEELEADIARASRTEREGETTVGARTGQ